MILLTVLIITTFSYALIAGFLFAFAVVIMPGLRTLRDGDFIRAFQAIDGVIQANQPLFVMVWAGSLLFAVIACVMGVVYLEGIKRILLLAIMIACLFGIHAPTFAINVPLNNELQRINVSQLSDEEQHAARTTFEAPWNRSNVFRTSVACLATLALLVLLVRL